MKHLFQRIFLAQKPEHEKQGLRSLEELKQSLFRVSVNYPFKTTFMKDEGNALLIGQDTFISLSSENYVEVAPGICQRVITGPDDIKFQTELNFSEEIRQRDFLNKLVIFVRFIHGDALKPHFHMSEQRITCLAGSYIGTLDGEVFRPGQVQVTPPKQIHIFQPVEDGFAIIEQEKRR